MKKWLLLALCALVAAPEPAAAATARGPLSALMSTKKKKKKKGVKKVRKKKRRPAPDAIVPDLPAAAEEEDELPPEVANEPDEAPLDPIDDEATEGTSSIEFEHKGYARMRFQHAVLDRHALLSGITPSQSEWLVTGELNTQPRLKLFDGALTLAGDVSLLGTSDKPHVGVALNELYLEASFFSAVYVTAGRRRISWGTGLSWNPTDLVNPRRDLLEPARTRAGALFLPSIDVALPWFTVSAFLSAPVTDDAYGLPSRVELTQPVIGARLMTRQLGVDMSMMYFRDQGKDRHSLGAAASSIIADTLEVHAEGVLHLGSVDRPPMQAVDACGPSLGDDPKVGGGAVAGIRHDWSDHSMVSVEYMYNSGGWAPNEYRLVRSELPCLRAAAKVAALTEPARAPAVATPLVLVRQHYLSVLAQRPHLTEDGWLEHIGISGGAIMSLSDASTVFQARVDATFSALTLGLMGAVTISPHQGEMSLSPTRGIIAFEARYAY